MGVFDSLREFNSGGRSADGDGGWFHAGGGLNGDGEGTGSGSSSGDAVGSGHGGGLGDCAQSLWGIASEGTAKGAGRDDGSGEEDRRARGGVPTVGEES